MAVLVLVFILLAKNIARTRTGRALQAIRDRDIAAEVMGVAEVRYKLIAFGISSFFAGIGGALYASLAGQLPATQFSLFLSVEFVAILLIGGVGTVTGVMLGTFFVVLSPRVRRGVHRLAVRPGEEGGIIGTVADGLLTARPGRLRARSRRRPRRPGGRSTSSTGTRCSTAS